MNYPKPGQRIKLNGLDINEGCAHVDIVLTNYGPAFLVRDMDGDEVVVVPFGNDAWTEV